MNLNKKILKSFLVGILAFSLTGCASLNSFIGSVKGSLIGQEFKITTYDDYANKTLSVSGSKVTVGLKENDANFNSDSDGYKSDVLEITVNGNQMLQVGNTILFEEKGLDMVDGFKALENINNISGGSIVALDKFVNNIANLKGTGKTIIVSSQMGIPIGVYQGEKVYVEIPEDLPKMTLLNIDGKALYIHRANYTILDSSMIK